MLKTKNRPLWPVSQLAPHTRLCDHTLRAIHCLHENTIAYADFKVNRDWKGVSGRYAGERTCAQQTDRIRVLVNLNHHLEAFGVNFAVNIEQFQQEPVLFALQDRITPVLLVFNETAGVGLIIAAIKGPIGLREGLPDLLLDVQVVVEPAALDKSVVLVRGAGPQE